MLQKEPAAVQSAATLQESFAAALKVRGKSVKVAPVSTPCLVQRLKEPCRLLMLVIL